MIKRAQYLTALILMLVVFMLFIMLESVNSTTTKKKSEIAPSAQLKSDAFSGEAADAKTLANGTFTAILASSDSDIGKNAALWCTYQKRSYVRIDSPADLDGAEPQYLIVDADALSDNAVLPMLVTLHEKGTVLIFSSLPRYSRLSADDTLKTLLGIDKCYSAAYSCDTTKLFDGFFLGGTQIFEKMKMKLPYVTLRPGGKVYMVGMPKQQGEIPNEMLPPMIWRYSDGTAPVFAVNADFCSDLTALGMYTAMVSETESYAAYPVVNAQNMVTLNYPNVSAENSEILQELYSMDAWQLSRDYLWQNVNMIYNASGDCLSCALSPQMSGGADEMNAALLPWYAAQLKKQNGEMLFSAELTGVTDSAEKTAILTRRLTAIQNEIDNVTTIYSASVPTKTLQTLLKQDAFSSVRTIIDGDVPPLGYFDEDVLSLGFTYDAYKNKDTDHLRMLSVFTALGYSSVEADAKRLYYPENDDDTWSKLGDEWASYHVTWWKPFAAFEKLDITDTADRARRFLAVDFSSARSGDTITATLDGFSGEAFFIVRLTGEKITSVSGGTYTKLETGMWLISAEAAQVKITVRQEGGHVG